MENLSSILMPIIDRGLRIAGAASMAVIAGFLLWWLL